MKLFLQCVLSALIGGPTILASAGIWRVPDPIDTIQAALDSCASGDTVLVAPGHYHERLVVPNNAVTLGSNTLLTGDTLFIPQTILDGDSLGTVITLNVGGMNRFILNGFTIQHGLGYLFHGGGIHFADSTDALLQNLHFTQNYSEYRGSVIYGAGDGEAPFSGPRRVILKHIRLYDNHIDSPTNDLIEIGANHYARTDDFICNDATNGIMKFNSRDSIIVNDYHVNNGRFRYSGALGAMLQAYTQNSYSRYSNISAKNCTYEHGALVSFGGHKKCEIENLYFENNRQINNRTMESSLLWIDINEADFQADSLIFRSNSGLMQNSSVGVFDISGNTSNDLISNLIVENCSLGDSSYIYWNTGNMPTMLTVSECSIRDALFRNNCITLAPGNNPPENGVFGANILRTKNYFDGSVRYHNLKFDNNMVIDLDDNESLPVHASNYGRCMMINSSGYQTFIVDSCTFTNNRQPNMAGERPYGGILDDGSDIGSILYIARPTLHSELNNVKIFEDLFFSNNDDGGIRSIGLQNFNFRNIQMVNVSRQAFKLETNSFTLENVLIDGCTPFEPIPIRSEQMPLWLNCVEPSTVRNCTIINTTTPYVVMAGMTPYQEESDPIITFDGCLFWNNQYDRFEALVPDYDIIPGWDSYRPGRFNHCLLPEMPEYGNNSLIGMDPLFDANWGAPYLSRSSPCIDLGDPDSAWNDLEDPARPGFSLWPSQGALRNDIGFTGGPNAAVFDTNWVALPRWEPRTLPQDFTLGNPWPNPFNPVTRIPYSLARPLPVRLRVYNLLGQEVAVLVNGIVPAGTHQAAFKPGRLASGLYLVTLEAGGRAETRVVTLLR